MQDEMMQKKSSLVYPQRLQSIDQFFDTIAL